MALLLDVEAQWVHIEKKESPEFAETYGFSGTQGTVNLEGIRYLPKGVASDSLIVFMHPASTLQLLPVPRKLAALGCHVLCAGSRYAKNDSALIMEKVLLDLGAYVRHAKEHWGYRKIILIGWSGGGSLALFYQSQAQRPTIETTPAGDVVDIRSANLIPADALICQAAHLSRARMLCEMIDPSVIDELDPEKRRTELDIYHSGTGHSPPYSMDFQQEFRREQRQRIDRITTHVKEQLHRLRLQNTGELERGFVTHRTLADLRFLDPAIDPNERRAGWCYLGNPETVNNGPVGLARFSTLRSWLSQWSIDDSRADGLACAPYVTVPFLAIENGADDCVPQPHSTQLYDAIGGHDKEMHVIKGATHYYAGQPELLESSATLVLSWLRQRQFAHT